MGGTVVVELVEDGMAAVLVLLHGRTGGEEEAAACCCSSLVAGNHRWKREALVPSNSVN